MFHLNIFILSFKHFEFLTGDQFLNKVRNRNLPKLCKIKQFSKEDLIDVIFSRPHLHNLSVIYLQGLNIAYEYHKGFKRST